MVILKIIVKQKTYSFMRDELVTCLESNDKTKRISKELILTATITFVSREFEYVSILHRSKYANNITNSVMYSFLSKVIKVSHCVTNINALNSTKAQHHLFVTQDMPFISFPNIGNSINMIVMKNNIFKKLFLFDFKKRNKVINVCGAMPINNQSSESEFTNFPKRAE